MTAQHTLLFLTSHTIFKLNLAPLKQQSYTVKPPPLALIGINRFGDTSDHYVTMASVYVSMSRVEVSDTAAKDITLQGSSGHRFLDLPLEARYIIYEYMDITGVSWGDELKILRLTTWKVPGMLYTNSQIRTEIMNHYRTYRFRYEVMPEYKWRLNVGSETITEIATYNPLCRLESHLKVFVNPRMPHHVELQHLQLEYMGRGPVGSFNVDYQGGYMNVAGETCGGLQFVCHFGGGLSLYHAASKVLLRFIQKRGGYGFALPELKLATMMVQRSASRLVEKMRQEDPEDLLSRYAGLGQTGYI